MRHKDENKKESIISSAIKLINETGFSETSMSKIAKRAGVSSSTIYIYFENKSDMINKLYLTVKKEMSRQMFQSIDPSMKVKTGFELVLRNYLDFLLRNSDYCLFIEQYASSPLIQTLSREEGMSLFQPMFEIFERGKRENIFKQVDTSFLISYAFAPVNQIAKACLNGELNINDEIIREILKMSWDAIKK